MKAYIASILLLTLVWQASSGASASSGYDPKVVFEKSSPSIVVVNGFGESASESHQGSGVAIDQDVIVTNCHVVQGSRRVEVVHGGAIHSANVTSADIDKDICILRLASPLGRVGVPAILGSTNGIGVGDRVVAIGAPRGLELSLSEGVVSGLRPAGERSLLQVTAPISPGSSGGGLFDGQGRLIGITTFQFRDSQQINFALPVEWVTEVAQVPIDSDTIARLAESRIHSTQRISDSFVLSSDGKEVFQFGPSDRVFVGVRAGTVDRLETVLVTAILSKKVDGEDIAIDSRTIRLHGGSSVGVAEFGRSQNWQSGVYKVVVTDEYMGRLTYWKSHDFCVVRRGEECARRAFVWKYRNDEGVITYTTAERLPANAAAEPVYVLQVREGERWLVVDEDHDRRISIDQHSVQTKGAHVVAWFEFYPVSNEERRRVENTKYLQQYQFDCKDRLMRMIHVAAYDIDGTYKRGGPANESVSRVLPRSVGEALMESACDN